MRRQLAALALAGGVALVGCGTTVPGAGLGPGAGTAANTSGGLAAPGAAATTSALGAAGGSAGQGPAGSATTGVGSGTQLSGPTGTGPTTAPAAAGGAVDRVAANVPIKLGFVVTTVGNASAFGVKVGNTVAEQHVDDALVRALNHQGGIDGHQIIPVYAQTNTATYNWDTDFQAACSTFTQDNHVAAVLGYNFNYEPDFETCLARAGIPHLSTTFNVPDNQELSRYPLLWDVSVPTIGERSLEKLDGAIATGFLTSTNRLGVLTDDCPGSQRTWTNVVQPFLQQHHLTVAATIDGGCASGDNASESGAVAQAGNAVLTFRSKGVDRIIFITVSEGPALYILANAAEQQHYYPGWIVSSLANLSTVETEPGSSPDQMRNVHGFGWMPNQDIAPAQYGPLSPAQQRCLSLLRSQNVVPRSAADYQYAYQSACDPLFLYQSAVTAIGGNVSGAAVIQAVAGLGSRFRSVVTLDGQEEFSVARRNNAPQVYRPVLWQSSCACFAYSGSTYSMP